jgi:hypothetical protein
MTLSMIDVTSTGAVGDGITDDAPAIQRAIDAIPPTGGIVFFPRGVYKIDTEIAIRDRGKIKLLGVPTRLDAVGELSGSCIQKAGAGSALNIEARVESGSERVGIWIDGLHIQGDDAAQPVVRMSRVFKVHIANTVITRGAADMPAYGLLLDRVQGLTMIDTRIDACGIGIKSAEDVENNFLNNFVAYRCEFANNSWAGVEIQGIALGFFGCNFEGQRNGACISAYHERRKGAHPEADDRVLEALPPSQAVTFQNCYFEDNAIQALGLGMAGWVYGLTVTGCYFYVRNNPEREDPERYIHLVAKGFVIEGNSFAGLGDERTEQIRMEKCENGRIGPNFGLDSNRITDVSGNSQIIIENEGAERVGYRVVNADVAVTSTDYIISADASAVPQALTITLPSAVGHRGRVMIVKKTDASSNRVQVVPINGQMIDGVATKALKTRWSVLRVASDGANWLIV